MTMPQVGLQLVVQNASQYVQQLNTAGTANQNFANSTINAANQFAESASTFGKPATALEQVWVGALRNIGGMITGKLAEFGAQITSFVASSPMAFAEFQDQMQNFGAAAGLTDEQTKPYEDLILMLGKELPVSTTETAQAAIEMVKGGIDPAILQIGGLRDVLNYANANMMDLDTSANLIAKTVGTFTSATATAEEQQRFMAEAMDYTTKVGNASTYTTQELMLGMLEAGGTAKAVGLEYGDFAVTMGALSPAFSSANVAGTSFKNFLLRLAPTSKEAYDQMEKMGLVTGDVTKYMETLRQFGIEPASNDIGQLTDQLYDYMKNTAGMTESEIDKTFRELSQSAFYANGELKSMAEISQVLQDATGDLTSEEKSYAMAKIFGNEAMNAAVRLTELGADGYNEFASTVDGANGITEQAAATQRGLEFEMSQVQGTMETLQIVIGKAASGPMEELYKIQNSILGTILDVALALGGNKSAYENLSGPLQTVIDYMNIAKTAYDSLFNISYNPTGGFYSLPLVVQSIVIGLRDLQTWFAITTENGAVFTSAWEYLVQVGNQVLAYFASLEPLLAPLYDAFDIIGKQVIEMQTIFQQSFGNIGAQIAGEPTNWVQTITEVFRVIVNIIAGALVLVSTIITGAVNLISGIWYVFGDSIILVIEVAMETIRFLFEQAMRIISTVIEVFIALMNGDFVGAMRAIVQYILDTWDNVLRFFTGIGESIIKAIRNSWDKLYTDFISAWPFAKIGADLIAGLVSGFVDNAAKAISEVLSWGRKLIKELKAVFGIESPSKEMMAIGQELSAGLYAGIASGIPAIESLMSGISQTIMVSPYASAGSTTQNTYNQTTTNQYHLGVTTRASAPDVISSFAIMKAVSV
jgi:TP901 family phage tail tape measure protein